MNNELNDEIRKEGGMPRHHFHGHHHHPFPLSAEMIESADPEILLRICCHDMRMIKAGYGSSQDAVLRVLNKEGSISQKDLQHRLHVAPGSVSELISKMEEKGLLVREKNEDDRRHTILHISEEGKEAARDLKEPEPFLKMLSDEELQTLSGLLKKVVRANHHLED